MARLPRLRYGPRARLSLAEELRLVTQGDRGTIVLVTGGRSLEQSGHVAPLENQISAAGAAPVRLEVGAEPSDSWVDGARHALAGASVLAVVSVGGGSVLDAGKALAAMLLEEGETKSFLEGVGDRAPSGRMVPWVALPTTAGTGSEATRNAVLGRVGRSGFKRSLRHPDYRAASVLLDPELAAGCPPQVAAACAMDAVTQLIEAYLSTASNPFLDRWLEWGLALAWEALPKLTFEKAEKPDLEAWMSMQVAALLSGVGLSEAGLGTVHGLAGVAGSRVPVPHGVFCARLLPVCLRESVAWLEAEGRNEEALSKLAWLGRVAVASAGLEVPGPGAGGDAEARHALVRVLRQWDHALALPGLAHYGLDRPAIDQIVEQGSNRQNPARLSPLTWKQALLECLPPRLENPSSPEGGPQLPQTA